MHTRREFLKSLSCLTLSSTVFGLYSCNGEEPDLDRRKKALVHRWPPSKVAVLKANSYESDLVDIVLEGIKACNLSVKGKSVVLKPNIVEYDPDTVINTHPAVIGAALEAFKRLDAKSVVVAEGPGHRRDTEFLVYSTGLVSILKELSAEYIDLNVDNLVKTRLRSFYRDENHIWLPETITRADIIVSMPKIKTHHWVGTTLSMKNMFGVVPGVKYGWPKNVLHWRGLEKSIIDIVKVSRPSFAIVDGIVGMEGDGPINGTPKKCSVLVFGTDLAAVDASCTRIMNINPERIAYMDLAQRFLGNVDEERVVQIGEKIEDVRTDFGVIGRLKILKS